MEAVKHMGDGEAVPGKPSGPQRSTPTFKMLRLARSIAKRLNVTLSDQQQSEFNACRDFIDQHSGDMKPSDKQIEYAERISQQTGVELPAEARADWKVLRNWLDKQAEGACAPRPAANGKRA